MKTHPNNANPRDANADTPLPDRKSPAHGVLISPTHPTIVFVTACTKDRTPCLATAEMHDLLRRTWQEAAAWLVGKYVVMPDHVHLICAPGEQEMALEVWMRYWKHRSATLLGDRAILWQPGHWDRRLRSLEKYEEKWDYVSQNPVRAGLVEKAEDWPYKGEIYELRW